jgi:2-dehydropantoate 2-reductase
MPILIVGTGALACLFAARLAGAGVEVCMLGSWREGLSALRQGGVRYYDLHGENYQYPVKVIADSGSGQRFSQALVLVKSWQTERAAKQLYECLSAEGVALTLQNGFGNYETLKETLGEERVAIGVTTVGAKLLKPGVVQFSGDGKLMLGNHQRLSEVVDKLVRAGFEVEMIRDPESVLWGKLVINAAINPLTALLRVPNGELLKRPSARALMSETVDEVVEVAKARGVNLPYANPVEMVENVARSTANNISSMLQDVMRGTPTEIEAINGAIIRLGESSGIETPVNRMFWRLVKCLDGG